MHRHEHMRARVLADERGIGIAEALVATLVLLIGVIATIGVFDDSRDQSATGERHEIALMQAEQALEEMRGIPYQHLILDAGAQAPAGGDRLLAAGEQFAVKPDLAERLVYYNSEGVPVSDAWVEPVSSVSVGPSDAALDMTTYRFVTWRDEECRVFDLDALGLDLSNRVSSLQGPLSSLLNSITGLLFSLLNPTNDALLTALETRLDSVNAKLSEIPDALAGVAQLDLCDLDLTLLGEIQQLGNLTGEFGQLNSAINALHSRLSNILTSLLCILGCQNQVSGLIAEVDARLDAIFSADDEAYLDGILTGIDELTQDLNDTDKNTKRITVGIVVEPRAGVGPFEPVWASSVVRDPCAGLLLDGGTQC